MLAYQIIFLKPDKFCGVNFNLLFIVLFVSIRNLLTAKWTHMEFSFI